MILLLLEPDSAVVAMIAVAPETPTTFTARDPVSGDWGRAWSASERNASALGLKASRIE